MTKTILVVEDDESNRAMLQIVIKSLGYDASFTDTAETALQMLEDNPPPDLIITDLLLPGMGGLDMVYIIREAQAPEIANIPIIAVTASPEFFKREQIERAGFHVLLPKPLRMEQLRQHIADSLSG